MPSSITVNKTGEITSYTGDQAVMIFRVRCLASAMILYKGGLGIGRGCMTGPQALKAASQYTGKTYKRGQYDEARADLGAWISEAIRFIPVERQTA